MRHVLDRRQINEGWRFSFPGGEWETVVLPHTWNALDTMHPDPAWHYRRGQGFYERDFVPPEDGFAGHTWLEFEAVAQRAALYFEGNQLAEHHGGYTAFSVALPGGPGTLLVQADNTPDPDLIPSDQSDFFLYGGITRNVWQYRTGPVWIEGLRVDPHIASATVRVRGRLAGQVAGPLALRVRLAEAEHGPALIEKCIEVSEAFDFALPPLRDVALWSPDSPALYHLWLELQGPEGDVFDCVTERFGFREASFPVGGAFLLNGKRLLLRGTHRHEDWAGCGGAVPDAITRQEFQLMKDAGFNFVRLGHYPQSRAALDACDELGLIVWEELPWCRGGVGGPRFKAYARAMLEEMIQQHYNHPSVMFWGLGNELDWESDHPDSDDDQVRAFLAELNTLAHALDPTRWTALRRFDYGADVVDVYSPSIWAGWYRGQYTDYEENLTAAMARYPRLLHAEWGGDSHVGRHNAGPHARVAVESTVDNAEEVGTATSIEGFARFSRDGDWSESYILDLMDWHLQIQAVQPRLAGTLQWAFKDFGTPLRPENPVPYVNQKGLLDRAGRLKDCYYLFRARQTSEPVVRIEGHTWQLRPAQAAHPVRVISNCAEVELFVDGCSLGSKTSSTAILPLGGLTWDVTLSAGSHVIRAVGDHEGEDTLQVEAVRLGTMVENFTLAASNLVQGLRLEVQLVDADGRPVQSDERRVCFTVRDGGALADAQGYMGGSTQIETANGRAWVMAFPAGEMHIQIEVGGLPAGYFGVTSSGRVWPV